jgi:hypothetical protein
MFPELSMLLAGKEVEFQGEIFHLIRATGLTIESGAELFMAVNTRAEYPATVIIIPVKIKTEGKRDERGGCKGP